MNELLRISAEFVENSRKIFGCFNRKYEYLFGGNRQDEIMFQNYN